jgi:hypothetical protein
MVGHEAVGVADPVVAFVGVLECIEKVQSVLLILENGLLLVPAGCDVVNGSGVFYTEGTCHNVATISQNKAIVNLQDVTL